MLVTEGSGFPSSSNLRSFPSLCEVSKKVCRSSNLNVSLGGVLAVSSSHEEESQSSASLVRKESLGLVGRLLGGSA